MYANYLKRESNPNKKWNLIRMSLEHRTLPLLAPRSTNWANGPLIKMYAKYIVFKQWMYANYLKRESNPNKRRNLVRVSLEHRTLPLLAPRSTDWANRPLDTNVIQIKIFYTMNVPKYFKRESNPNKKWNLVRMSLEHTTLPLLAPRSTDWANRPLDTNVIQIKTFYLMNVPKLLKKRK